MSRLSSSGAAKAAPITVAPISAVLQILDATWKQSVSPTKTAYSEPLDGLIETVLSQNTNDRNRDAAFARLKAKGTWAQIAALPTEEISEAIRPAGLTSGKTATIVRVLAAVKETFGDYTLEPLKTASRETAWEFLTGIRGVGPKTAACVLAFDLGIPAFPVDTHVARIARRLGWARPTESPANIQVRLEEIVPADQKLAGHLNIIQHGKNICRARNPKCPECPLRGICPSAGAAS